MAMNMELNPETMEAVEDFLDDLRSTTGVSSEFLDAARPIVRRLFNEVAEEERPLVESKIRETVCRHAVVEFGVRRAAAILEEDGDTAVEELPVLDCSSAVSFFLAAHGGFGPSEPSLA